MIYCVEDDAGIRELVVYTLRNTGFEADGFEDGAALTTALKKCKPQLILLDIMMPDMNGYEVIERLKADERFCRIPVIFLSALHDSENIVKGFKMGAGDYVSKPFNHEELITRWRIICLLQRRSASSCGRTRSCRRPWPAATRCIR